MKVLSQTTRAPARMRDVADGLQIRDDHHRIGRRLDKHHLRVVFDCGFDVRNVRRVDEVKLDAVVRENLLKSRNVPP